MVFIRFIHLTICSVFIQSSISYTIELKSKTLLVQDNTTFSNPIIIESKPVLSVIDCAAVCGMMTKCRGSTYERQSKICSLVPEFTEKIPDEDSMIIIKAEDCNDLPRGSPSGVYSIFPGQSPGISVYCDMDDDDTGWTVLQRRMDGSTNFTRNWKDYKHGFGNVNTEYWIGNDNIHILTSNKNYSVRFDLEAFDGDTAFAEYTVFAVDSEETNYKLTLLEYSGTAGDGMRGEVSINGMMFSTFDRDNDMKNGKSCAITKKGGWWFEDCCRSNMNGLYLNETQYEVYTINWRLFKEWHSMKAVTMKIKENV